MADLEIEKLKDVPRLLLEVELEPVQGARFQPTGFPDLGAAVYERPDRMRMILLETAQSMANRFEEVCLDGGGPKIAKELNGLPYIHVELKGKDISTETSSLVEAHRINSPFIMNPQHKDFQNKFKEMAGYAKGKPIDWKKVGKAIFYYDTNSILHGTFMANLEDGRIKVPRALTGYIEAEDIREAASGGVKNNPIDPTGKIRAEEYDKNVYSNVPYHRMEYTAGKITAYFNFDLSLIDGIGFDPAARNLLIALGLYKIQRFIRTGLRLRTACDLKMKGGIRVTAPEKFPLPAEEELLKVIQKEILACAGKGLFANPPVTDLVTKVKEVKGDKKTHEDDEEKPVS
ncbi:MAG: type I-U CRISPR-associated RAMP protein Csb1/Cas7u [Deltaproteobacteria bacterium]